MEDNKKIAIARIVLVFSVLFLLAVAYVVYRLADIPGMPVP